MNTRGENGSIISQTGEYALRAIVFLAMDPGIAYTTLQISVATKVPGAYLSKVMQSLVRAGLVQSQRGFGGGFLLSRSPDSIALLEVLDAVDPIPRIRSCPLGLESHGINLCALHKKLDDATATIETVFRETTIGDLLVRPTQSIPLCNASQQ